MNEREFLDAIARAPDDDLPRRAFADWLEDKHDPRAAWVRNKRIWQFMAPEAADPVPRLVDAAKKDGDPVELASILAEIGPAAWNAFIGALSEPGVWPPPGRPTIMDWIAVAMEPWLAKHRRPAWGPVVEAGDGPVTASKFCGTPWIGENAPWPDCGDCRKPLQLFLQLDLGDLPTELAQRFGTGLLQLFYCTRRIWLGGSQPFSAASCCGYEEFSTVSCVRIVQPTGVAANSLVPEQDEVFPPRRITGWARFLDAPDSSDAEELGLKHDFSDKLECPELGLAFDNIDEDHLFERIGSSTSGDKLAGWPCWVQGLIYPNCSHCGRRMGLVFQVDSQDNVPWMFGDCGIGRITQCPDHKNVVAFGWDGT